MPLSRRDWMKTTAAALGPTLLVPSARAYDVDEVERRLADPNGVEGVSKQDLPTPALILDLDALESNIARMASHAKQAGVDLRPHAKTHKTPEIAKRQVAAGALGACAATIPRCRRRVSGLITSTSELSSRSRVSDSIARWARSMMVPPGVS